MRMETTASRSCPALAGFVAAWHQPCKLRHGDAESPAQGGSFRFAASEHTMDARRKDRPRFSTAVKKVLAVVE